MGRQPSYDVNEVLRAAVDVFKADGFHRVSVASLVAATGLNRFALYEKFGGKEGLFYETLDYYYTVMIKEELLGPLYRRDASLETVLDMLESVREINRNEDHRSGCLIVNANTELAGQDERVALLADSVMAAFHAAVTNALVFAEHRRELTKPCVIIDAADHVVLMIQAFFSLAYISREAADRLISTLIREVGSWRAIEVIGPAGAPSSVGEFQNDGAVFSS